MLSLDSVPPVTEKKGWQSAAFDAKYLLMAAFWSSGVGADVISPTTPAISFAGNSMMVKVKSEMASQAGPGVIQNA